MVRKVLLMSMNVGGGHTALRDAFAASLARLDPEGHRFEVVRYESRDETTLAFYTWVVRHLNPFQWVVHRFSGSERVLRTVLLREEQGLIAEGRELLTQHRPDVVISAHLILTGAMVIARNQLKLPTKIVTAIPDYGPPTRGFFPKRKSIRPDGAITMEERAYEAILERSHATTQNVHLSGFLPRPPFEQLGGQLEGRRRLTLEERGALAARLSREHPQLAEAYDPTRPTAIFLGGSAWTEKTLPVIKRALADGQIAREANLLVVAGRNPSFEATARALVAGHPNAAVFGFISPETMASLLALADVPVLGSLAPATLQELLEVKLGPILLFHYIPGTENPHIGYIRDQHVGLYEPDADIMLEHLREALGLAAPGGRLSALMRDFEASATRIRAENRARAAQLGDFLESISPRHPAATDAGLRIAS